MRFHLALALAVAAIAAPAAQAQPPVPSLDDVLRLLPGPPVAQDYCVWEVDRDGNRRAIVCVPAGRLPELAWEIEEPR